MKVLAFTVTLLLTACSEAPQKTTETKKEPAPPPEPVTGESAFFKMYTAARGWAVDVEPLQLVSIHLEGLKKEPGKAAAWRATFVSPSRHGARSYTYSAIEAEGNLHKGIFAGHEEGWTGPKGVTRPFQIQALKIDSDAAYQTALKKGKNAAAYAKKNPDKNISFLLELSKRFPNLAWRVIWGDSVSASNYSVFVDASTGEYLETMR